MAADLDADETRVVSEVEARRDDLVRLAADLIGFDTTARELDDPARDEAALQEYLGGRLGAVGATVDVWEPAPEDVAASPIVPARLTFEGRPQLAARFPGIGSGRSLLLNGHVDAVSATPRSDWTSDPYDAEVRDGRLYGRGACDMKGGIAAMVLAAEVLASTGTRLRGDLVVCTVTDEESTGAGGAAAVAHGVRADAGIVTEPSGLDVWVACRGSLIPTISVAGRAAHAGVAQPPWSEGGAVNAIEKAEIVMGALRDLQSRWRSEHRHPYLSTGDIVPVQIRGGEWIVTYPAACDVTYHIAYLPSQADADGWGGALREEIADCVARAAGSDPWLAEHPPSIAWAPEVPPAEIDPDHRIVETMLDASADVGRPGRRSGMDSWHDGATFMLEGGTPCICYGPTDHNAAHAVDEYVPVDDLVACAQAIAVCAMRFCGTAAEGTT